MARIRDQMSMDFVSVTTATIFNQPNLGTTIQFMPSAATTAIVTHGVGVNRRVQISNRSASAYVAFKLTTEASPAFTASAAGVINTDSGVNIAPATDVYLSYAGTLGLWLVASAASTPVQVVFYDSVMR